MYNYKTLDDVDLGGKTVLVRVDFNVPINKEGNIKEDTRIKSHIKTIEYLLDNKCKIVLISHLGNKGQSLQPVAERLAILLNKAVNFVDDCVGEKVKNAISELGKSSVLLLENVRIHQGEKENDVDFSKELASLADVYVNDAFATAHRKHTSTYGVAKFAKEKCAGLLMASELKTLNNILKNPKKPFVVITGGVKVSTKLGALKSLAAKADTILIGGAMSHTFLKAMNVDIGKSMIETEMLDEALHILQIAKENNCKIILPSDVTTALDLKRDIECFNPNINDVRPDHQAFDIGKSTAKVWAEVIKNAGTILWNGPAGVFEVPPFDGGTKATAKAIGETKAFTVIGGGDSIHAAAKYGIIDKIDYISTGGGSLLQLIEGKPLPAIKALEN